MNRLKSILDYIWYVLVAVLSPIVILVAAPVICWWILSDLYIEHIKLDKELTDKIKRKRQ